MEQPGQIILKTLVIIVALTFLGGVMLTTVDSLFGGSKVRALFGLSADALAGETDGGVVTRRMKSFGERHDAGTDAGTDAGEAPEETVIERAHEPTFMPASKSFGGGGLPGLNEILGGVRGRPDAQGRVPLGIGGLDAGAKAP